MKNQIPLHFGILALASFMTAGLSLVTGNEMARNWEKGLTGEPLPAITMLATTYGYLGPLFCALLATICAVLAWRKGPQAMHYWFLFTSIAVTELMLLGLLGYWYVLPSFTATYIIGGK